MGCLVHDHYTYNGGLVHVRYTYNGSLNFVDYLDYESALKC